MREISIRLRTNPATTSQHGGGGLGATSFLELSIKPPLKFPADLAALDKYLEPELTRSRNNEDATTFTTQGQIGQVVSRMAELPNFIKTHLGYDSQLV